MAESTVENPPVEPPNAGDKTSEEIKAVASEPTATDSKSTDAVADDQAGEQSQRAEEKTGSAAAAKAENGSTSERRELRGGDRTKGHFKKNQGSQGFKSNIKSDFSSLKESDDPVAIRKQVEFYFSDSNLAGDKFLFTQVGGHENNAVPIEVIHSFKRMRHFQPFSAVIAALKDSKALEVVDDDTAIKRKTPLAEGFEQKSQDDIRKVIEDKGMAQSVYVKGFGDEEPSTQFDIEAFFAPYGTTNQVRLRRDFTKHFKGSVFVEFDTEDTQKKFLTLDPKPTYKGKDLVIKSKKQYCDEKVDEINKGNIRPREGSYGKGFQKKDDRDWRERRDEDRKNGFKGDNRHKGGRGGRGSHRGGRGRQGGYGGRDRNEERRFGDDKKETSESKEGTATSSEATEKSKEPQAAQVTTESDATEGTKKRTLEEADSTDQPSKKQKEDVTSGS